MNRGRLLVVMALAAGLSALPEADAKGAKGGGHATRPPRMSRPHPAYKPPRMPRAASPSHSNAAKPQSHPGNKQSRANQPQAKSSNARGQSNGSQSQANGPKSRNKNAQVHNGGTPSHANSSQVHAGNANATGTTGKSATGAAGTGTKTNTGTNGNTGTATAAGAGKPATNGSATTPASSSPYTYTYGSGTGARRYRAYGYGRGYRNRSSGRRSGYGRSQGNNRAVVARLRSVHASLARVNQSYQGHRTRAMQHVSMAIRQLSHRSTAYTGGGLGAGANNRVARAMRRGGGGPGNGARRAQPMTQAQADARMGQALRNLQGINMQLAGQGTHTGGHSRARGHVTLAIREVNTALAIR